MSSVAVILACEQNFNLLSVSMEINEEEKLLAEAIIVLFTSVNSIASRMYI